jgi:hypothetical protein
MGSWCGSSSSSTATGTTAAPQWVQDQFKGTADIANSLANRGADQLPMRPDVAGLNGAQLTAGGSFINANNAANGGTQTAGNDFISGSEGLSRGANYVPQNVTAADVAATPNVTAGRFTDANVGQYMSPFLQNVADTSLYNLNRQNQIALNNVRSQAETEGAYGGARQGVAEAETNRGYADTGANLLANLFGTGFTNAQGQINADQNRGLSADQGNQSIGFQTNALRAQLAQQAALANQRAGLDANAQSIGASNNLVNASTTGFGNAQGTAGALFGFGGAQQQIDQGNRDVAYQNAQNLYNQPAQNLALRLSGQGQSPLAYGNTTSQPVYSNPLGTGAGLALAAGSLFGKGGALGNLFG